MKRFMLITIILLASVVSCAPVQPVIELRGIAYPSPPQSTWASVEWLVPGADMSGLSLSTYYVEIDIFNKGQEKTDIPGIEAYFYGEDGSILLIKVVQSGKLERNEKVTFHLDTDGYTSWLLMSLNENAPVTLCILIKSKGEIISSFATNLPTYTEFRSYESLTLSFSLTEHIPNIDALQPVKADELGIPGGFGIGPPAVMRKQGDETALYFYYRKP